MAWITDPNKTIVALVVVDPGRIHLARQPKSTVETKINVEGKPALDPHMQHPKLLMHVVMIEMGALTSLEHQLDLFGLLIAP